MRLRITPAAVAGIVALCLVLAAGSFYAYLSFNARRIFNAQVSALTQRRVEVAVVRAEFPAKLVVEGLSVAGLLTCDRVVASVDVRSLLGRDIRIGALEMVHPVLVWDRTVQTPLMEVAASGKEVPAPSVSGRNVLLSHLLVHDGVLKVVMKNEEGGAREYAVDRIQLRARHVSLTDTPAHTEFFVTASLERVNAPFVGRFLKASGWLNWAAKDMDAKAQVMDDNGRVGLDATLSARQNDMTVFGKVVLAGGQEPQADGKKARMIENVLLSVLAATNTDMQLDFSFKTKMDHIEIGQVGLSGHITTGLNSSATSGNIVAGLKVAVEEVSRTSENADAVK